MSQCDKKHETLKNGAQLWRKQTVQLFVLKATPLFGGQHLAARVGPAIMMKFRPTGKAHQPGLGVALSRNLNRPELQMSLGALCGSLNIPCTHIPHTFRQPLQLDWFNWISLVDSSQPPSPQSGTESSSSEFTSLALLFLCIFRSTSDYSLHPSRTHLFTFLHTFACHARHKNCDTKAAACNWTQRSAGLSFVYPRALQEAALWEPNEVHTC